MTMLSTTNQGAPFPQVNEPINNVNDWVEQLALFMEVRGVQRFADMATLSTKRPSPAGGEMAYITADKSVYVYDTISWKRVFPPSPMVYSGTTTPAAGLGAVGDLYIQVV